MSTTVFVAVLGAAILHAGWNALVKGGADKLVAMGAVVIGHAPLALLALFFVPLPAAECLPFLLGGITLHVGYQIFLMRAYQTGDLTQVYPIARGSAPLIVALFSMLVLGVHLERMEVLAIAIIGIGILSLAIVRRSDGQRNPNAAALALTTGLFIASYSLVDGLGARLSGSAVAYFSWMALINAVLMALYLVARRPGTLRRIARQGRLPLLVGGPASYVAYSVVTWAFTQAPIALVTALRETSIVFALLIGVVVMKERLDLAKLFSTAATLSGAMLLRFSR
ncbi:EamA family transporter [Roseovarius dicentrarchi]|uniref:EamA family transporter n=1 Tax=Roseovarius dicentrarchi TaxID=2250573 RepID=UPI000DE9505F|nr:EamA family transporter [Roseovarius dicentrarchi]